MMNRLVAGSIALAAAACGGSGQPTRPTATPTPQATPQALTIISGETGAPVAGARVIVHGQELTTDGAGRVTAPGGLFATTLVDVLAEGFLDRQTLLSRATGGTTYALWPRASATGLDEQATGQIVYTWVGVGQPDPPFAQQSLLRWAPGHAPVEVVLQGPATDPAYREFSASALIVHAEAVAAMNDALGGRLVLQPPVPRDGVPAADRILVRIQPEHEYCVNFDVGGFAQLTAPAIRQATITYCDARSASSLSVATHELGHAVGMWHSPSPSDIMFPFRNRTVAPSPRERLILGLMYQRLPGNRFPDNDRSATTASNRTVELLCR